MGNTPMERLVDLAKWIFAWQSQQKIKDAQMIRQFPGLGSAKTYRDIHTGNVGGYDVDRWLAEYGMVKNEIEMKDQALKTEDVFDDLSTVVNMRRAALDAMATNGSNRVVIVQGGSGCGKSFALKALTSMYGSRIMVIEALDAWNDKPGHLLGAILEQFGFDNPPVSTTARLAKLLTVLRRSRTMIAVDEAHHMGPHCINTIKALINKTPGEFMLLAMGTLWDRLETSTYQEAAQIAKNRLCERVVLELDIRDVGRYIRHRFEGIAKEQLVRMATLVKQAADDNGNLSFVRDVCAMAERMIGDDVVLATDTLQESVTAVSNKRAKNKRGASNQ